MARLKDFRLQKVLEFKKHLEVINTLELHQAQTNRQKAEQQLNILKQTKQKLLEETEDQLKQQNRLDLNDLKVHVNYLSQLHESIENLNKSIIELQKDVERKRNKLNESVKERKIIQTLKDQFQERKNHEIKRMENGMIDEIALRNKVRGKDRGE